MVRYATREELERVNELRKIVNEVHCNGRPDIFKAGFCKELREFVYTLWEGNNSDVIVVLRDNEICGYACVDYVDRPESPYNLARRFYHINEFGVDEKYRRQGVATELFDFIKKEATSKNFDKVELDMWEFNDGALKFYEAVGFITYRRFMEFTNK
ncbi:GNAT family N-acetyltransferase [Clostridium sp. D43t1_170807_H7]|uniref:GNAT family N-acetyltransferase n=1 Tax=Clostridium sp. D43t1_170807_H7 TaxID=2787140 RepID=UPI0018994608|nr:GNAT family N-acetyltransferase [Clostridium sp. D43t1_170807_H7]MEE0933716.1 GNAT family N-acetyltransferase [Clostridium sp.]